jgi:hypothetical protein
VARTFLDIVNEALSNDFDATTYRARAQQYVEEAVHRVARRAHIPSLEQTQTITTANGTSTYALDSDAVRILSISNTADHDPVPEVDVDEIDNYDVSSGKPLVVALSANQLVFWPTPDAVYSFQVRYLGDPVFSSDTDTTTGVGFPDDYADLLVTYARMRLFRSEDDFDAAAQYRGEFEAELLRLKSDLHRQSPRRVRRVGDRRLGTSPSPRIPRP